MQLRSLALSLNSERSSKSRRSGFQTAIVGKCLRVPPVDFDHTDSARYLPKGAIARPGNRHVEAHLGESMRRVDANQR